MTQSLERRLLVSFAPLVALVAALGAGGLFLLHRLGNAGGEILRENYDSVVAMVGLNEALERIDSSFQFALAGRADAKEMFDKNWPAYRDNLRTEQRNVTIPGEQELVDRLVKLTDEYRAEGERFYKLPTHAARYNAYYPAPDRPTTLLTRFEELKTVSGAIREMNQRHMESASRSAKATAEASQVWLAGGLIGAALVAAVLAWQLARSVARPLRELTRAAAGIGAGDLDQLVPVARKDEVGQLAEAFNGMARRLRDYRQSNTARLVRAQQSAQAAIDSFPDAVLVVDPEGRVEMANPAAHRLFGVAPGEDGGAPVPWAPPGPLRQPLAEALRDQRPYRTESFGQALVFRLDGEDRAFLPQVLPVRDPHGGTLGAAVVLTDVTRFRLLDQFKSDLVATASHELKTPLTAVRLALHVLLEEQVGPLNPKQTELLIDARDNAERLLDRVEHLLALARLEQTRGPADLRPEDPADLLRRAADAARPRADDRRVGLEVSADGPLPPVAVNPGQIDHALGNLLDNALAYTKPGGRVTLSAADVGGGRVRLSIADTGVGIPPEYLPHVFDRFFRVPGQSDERGTGLGLAIVKQVVEAHGGTVACDSQPGRGTTFSLTLPAWGEGPLSPLAPASGARGQI
jgi:PAS domain S-box-containing protein